MTAHLRTLAATPLLACCAALAATYLVTRAAAEIVAGVREDSQ